MSTKAGRINVGPEAIVDATESLLVVEKGQKLKFYTEREDDPAKDIAYRTMRLKRILYNKFIRNKPKSKVWSESIPFLPVWKSIPE